MPQGKKPVIKDMNTLEGHLRFARVTAGVAINEMYPEMHCGNNTIGLVERGLRKPDKEFLERYWTALVKLSQVPIPDAYWEKIMQLYQEQYPDTAPGENQGTPTPVEQREPEVDYYLVEGAKDKLNGQHSQPQETRESVDSTHKCTYQTVFSPDGLALVKSCTGCSHIEVAYRKHVTNRFELFEEMH